MTVKLADVAKTWLAAGVSVIPILAKANKKPAVRWGEFTARAATMEEAQEWWGNGHPWGIALICGAVSGNLEMTEIEGRAVDGDTLTALANACDEWGCGEVWDRLAAGYTQQSPSGGLHLLYRISDHEVPGNTKLAHNQEGLVLAETRGEGGYVVGAPSPGACHPSGEPWLLTSGRYGDLPTVTWAERKLLHAAITHALDHAGQVRTALSDTSAPAPPTALPCSLPIDRSSPATPTSTLTPWDDFADRVDWSVLLTRLGWQHTSSRGAERLWTRPGKDGRDGISASTDYDGKRGFWVWSTSTEFPAETPMSKLFVYAHMEHGGDLVAASRHLRELGYGSPLTSDLSDFTVSETGWVAEYTFDHIGQAKRLLDSVRGRYIFAVEENCFYTWTGTVWEPDWSAALAREAMAVTDRMRERAQKDGDDLLLKWAGKCRSSANLEATQKVMGTLMGVRRRLSDFNPDRHLLNLGNGILDLRTHQLMPHDPKYLMTRVFGASFDEKALCPRFLQFMEEVLPDPVMRDYVKRALGYTLLGDADRRSMFLIHGPSGTGKSTLMEIMRFIFGDYGHTAAQGTFKFRRDGAITNDLHGLRGKRFVTTSETAETTAFDEDLLKRLTGRDRVKSRELYEKNQEWTPECALWLATNHPPRFNSDDDAIWRRAKLIPFTTQFTGEREIPDMARTILADEADGILNWLLEGLADFQANGLGEPEAVQLAAQEQRHQSDSVMRFLDDKLADGILVEGPEQRIRYTELYGMYQEYVRTVSEKPLGVRRFINRLTSMSELESHKVGGHMFWSGIGRASGASILGSWGLQLPQRE